MISSKIRIRFLKLPPYLSVLLLVYGDKNSLIRYPCAAWISTPSIPAVCAITAPLIKAFTIPSHSSVVSARGISFTTLHITAEGATICFPPSSLLYVCLPG